MAEPFASSVKPGAPPCPTVVPVKPTTRTYYEDVVARAIGDVRAALDDALDLAALAKRAALSPLHFHHVFRGLVGETPLEMHRRLRLERAAIALATSDAPVTRIAFEAGYETHESFTRAFRAAFAASPSEFRASALTAPVPWTASTRATLAAPSGIHVSSSPDAAPHLSNHPEPTMNVTVGAQAHKRVLAVAHRGPYSAISEAFAELDRIVRHTTLLAEPGLEMIAIFHDDPQATPPAELRADAGLVVPAQTASIPGLHEVTIPDGLYARTTHEGPYETLGDTWSRFMGRWLAQSPYRIGEGPAYERYLNTPNEAAPSDLRTELYLSVVGGG